MNKLQAMENDREKRLQEKMLKAFKNREQAGAFSEDEDQEAYRLLFDILSEKEDLHIPRDFAEAVTKKAVRRQKITRAVHSAMMYALPVTILLITSVLSLFFIFKDTFTELTRFVRIYGNYMIFAAVVIILVQLADRWFIPKKPGYPPAHPRTEAMT